MLYTTETYIDLHCTVGTITLRHDQECRSYTKSIEPNVRFIYKDKTKGNYMNAFYASKISVRKKERERNVIAVLTLNDTPK